jgi:hypothetical protein
LQWVTRDHVHLDRVAAPWLILRFIDPRAEFLFVQAGGDPTTFPAAAVPFGLPNVTLSSHDAAGSTFRKIMDKYAVATPALVLLAAIIEDAIAHFLRQKRDGGADINKLSHPESIGLIALSEGMMYECASDTDCIERSLPIYDALYAYCQAALVAVNRPELAKMPPYLAMPIVKPLLVASPFRSAERRP